MVDKMDRLSRIIKEEIEKALGGKYIYHALARLSDLPNVLKHGLIPNNWDGVFFSTDTDYNGRTTALLRLPLTDENIKKYNITVRNVTIIYGTVYPQDLELYDCIIGNWSSPNLMMAREWINQGVSDWSLEALNDVIDYLGIEFFYEDICLRFFGEEVVNRLKQTGVPFKRLL